MADILRTKLAAAARAAGIAALLCAGTAALVGFAGAAHAAPGAAPPDSNHAGAIYGNPAAAAPYWRHQTSSDCGEMSVADVVGQVTGDEPTEQQITTMAQNTRSTVHSGSMWAPGEYTSNGDLTVLLARYAIEAVASHSSIQALEQDLADGQKVIVGLNDETIWNEPGDRTNEDHFVVVTGVDTRADVVHLNDSGSRKGRDEQVPVATFETAWSTSHNFIVVTTQ
jgi:Peptidase_C39 like family